MVYLKRPRDVLLTIAVSLPSPGTLTLFVKFEDSNIFLAGPIMFQNIVSLLRFRM